MGWSAVRVRAARTKTLRGLIAGLKKLERELSFRLTPMPELLRRVGEESEGVVRTFFLNCGRLAGENDGLFSARWAEACEGLRGQAENRAVVCMARLGSEMGRYDWEETRKVIAFTCSELEEYLLQEQQEDLRRGRLYRTLSAAAGAALVILLL